MNLINISPDQYANDQASKINQNFSALKSAVEQTGGGGGGGGDNEFFNYIPLRGLYDTTLPKQKVLAIGNSFLLYPLYPFVQVIGLSGAESTDYYLQHEGITGSSGNTLKLGLDKVKNNTAGSASAHKCYGSGGWNDAPGYRSALSSNWDAIIFQQRSDDVTDYTSYQPYLAALAAAAKHYCTNRNVKIGWHMIWDKYHGTSNSQREMIVVNTRRVIEDCGIDFIVPTGTAFENAWANGMTLQLDGSGHPTNAAAQFLASATWYQALYSVVIGKDIVDDMAPSTSLSWTSAGSTLTISPETAVDAEKCAKAACEDMWNVSTNIL